MFRQISVNQKQNKSCIKELSDKHVNSNRRKLFRQSVFLNELHKFDGNYFKNGVYNDDDERNSCSQSC